MVVAALGLLDGALDGKSLGLVLGSREGPSLGLELGAELGELLQSGLGIPGDDLVLGAHAAVLDDTLRRLWRDGLIRPRADAAARSIRRDQRAGVVRRDLDAFFARMVPDGDPLFGHTAEGPDDMPSHIRAALTSTSLGVPVIDGRLALGTWQGIYLWEHRADIGRRRVVVSVW